MKKIVFLDAATLGSDVSLQPIADCGQFTAYDTTSPDDVVCRMADADVVITNKVRITQAVIDACPHLRLICEAATGTDNIDVAYARSRGVEVRNVAGYSTESVVQITIAHALHALNRIDLMDAYVKGGNYTRSGLFTCVDAPFSELCGKRWGIIGLGTIGRRVACVAQALGAHVAYYSTTGANGSGAAMGITRLAVDELLETSDVVSIHAPLNEATRGLIGYDRLRSMKSTAILINMGRGGIVDETDLARALDEGLIGMAALDVFTSEPLPQSHPLLHLKHPERIVFTPHIGWASREARRRLIEAIAHNIKQ